MKHHTWRGLHRECGRCGGKTEPRMGAWLYAWCPRCRAALQCKCSFLVAPWPRLLRFCRELAVR